ncbi:hypothetical protein LINPERPRIM_LOCUS156, partial [Linum perenne]
MKYEWKLRILVIYLGSVRRLVRGRMLSGYQNRFKRCYPQLSLMTIRV